jgi:uncharacterized zinc-type alcohol dehydrogenase-like protein
MFSQHGDAQMITVPARCVCGPHDGFRRTTIERRDPGPHDVLIDIAYAGICHSDIEHARQLRAGAATTYPLVPGHEIVGVVSAVGAQVTKFKIGDRAGVGNMVDSCRVCANCLIGLEQYCSGKRVLTYNSPDRDGRSTQGGYSQKIVVDEAFVVSIPPSIPLPQAAPLLCAGITMYSSMQHWKVGPGSRVAILGLGGLGHVGVQIAKALGAHTTVLELSPSKREDALRLGADAYHLTSDSAALKALANHFDLLISTVALSIHLDVLLDTLALDGSFVNLALPDKPLTIPAATLLNNRRSIAGTRSGGLAETQEMLDFCAVHGIAAEVEVIAADGIDEACQRLLAGDVRFRFVIDNSTL